jgi:hypothetical protein
MRAPRPRPGVSPTVELAASILGARASSPASGRALRGGWGMHGTPSPCGLHARGRASLQPWNWQRQSWERGRPRPHPGGRCAVAGVGMAPRRPVGSTPEAGRLSNRGIGSVNPGSAGVLARIRESAARRLVIDTASRRHAGPRANAEELPRRKTERAGETPALPRLRPFHQSIIPPFRPQGRRDACATAEPELGGQCSFCRSFWTRFRFRSSPACS